MKPDRPDERLRVGEDLQPEAFLVGPDDVRALRRRRQGDGEGLDVGLLVAQLGVRNRSQQQAVVRVDGPVRVVGEPDLVGPAAVGIALVFVVDGPLDRVLVASLRRRLGDHVLDREIGARCRQRDDVDRPRLVVVVVNLVGVDSGTSPVKLSTIALLASVVIEIVSAPAPASPLGSVHANSRSTASPGSIGSLAGTTRAVVVLSNVWPVVVFTTTIRSSNDELTATGPSLTVCQRMVNGPPETGEVSSVVTF